MVRINVLLYPFAQSHQQKAGVELKEMTSLLQQEGRQEVSLEDWQVEKQLKLLLDQLRKLERVMGKAA